MSNKKNRNIRIDEDALNWIKNMSFKLSDIEKKRIAEGEVVKRVISAEDIPTRLINGSLERANKRKNGK